MTINCLHRHVAVCLGLLAGLGLAQADLHAQGSKLPPRAKPPQFESNKFDGIFFPDVNSALSGELPKSQSSLQINSSPGGTAMSNMSNAPGGIGGSSGEGADPMGWKGLISPASIEDLIKGSKLRLDKIVTTPTAFAGGGYEQARREFSLLSLLFAIVENYPGDVRWKASASAARGAMERTAANTKVGSRQVYDESKKRLADLQQLLNGSALTAEVKTEIVWENLIDISPLMKLLQWAHEDQIAKMTASEDLFKQNQEEIARLAELVAVLGRASTFEKMPNADDAQFVAFAKEMIAQAQQINSAVQSGNAELARTAAGKLGQSCTACHESYR
ncbi:MAG: cytochrome c [Pirellulales bacterium]